MDQIAKSMKGYSWGGFSAIFATALLFTALPLLTRIQIDRPPKSANQPVFISPYKPPPPVTEEINQREEPKMIEKDPLKKIERSQRVTPKFDMPGIGTAVKSGPGLIEIKVETQKEIDIPRRPIPYDPDEVDQPPRYLKTVPAQYPFLAKRDNIEGKVLLRFVVDLDGLAKEVEVANAEPAGFFEEAALKAIERYKFKPAIKDGEAVMCNASLVISFVLD